MEKTDSNRRHFTDCRNSVDTLRTPISSSCVAVAHHNSTFSIPHSQFTKCHYVTLREKTVLAKRTHLKLTQQKKKCECACKGAAARSPISPFDRKYCFVY